jgi:hypothetical protein
MTYAWQAINYKWLLLNINKKFIGFFGIEAGPIFCCAFRHLAD